MTRDSGPEEDWRPQVRRGVREAAPGDARRDGSRRAHRLSDVLGPEDIRETNLFFHEDRRQEYDRVDPDPMSGEEGTLRWIRSVPTTRLRELLDAVDNFSEDALPAAWSWYMALSAGLHYWPDANHRTGQTTFAHAASEAFGIDVALAPRHAEDLVRRSKEWRNARKGKPSLHELNILEHPYRRIFREFEGALDIELIE